MNPIDIKPSLERFIPAKMNATIGLEKIKRLKCGAVGL